MGNGKRKWWCKYIDILKQVRLRVWVGLGIVIAIGFVYPLLPWIVATLMGIIYLTIKIAGKYYATDDGLVKLLDKEEKCSDKLLNIALMVMNVGSAKALLLRFSHTYYNMLGALIYIIYINASARLIKTNPRAVIDRYNMDTDKKLMPRMIRNVYMARLNKNIDYSLNRSNVVFETAFEYKEK